MILHICTLDKFIPPFIELINKEFDPKQHYFLVYGDKERYPFKPCENIEYNNFFVALRGNFLESAKNILRFISLASNSDKIILHNLFDINLVRLLAFMNNILKKCYWVIWGGDLYHFKFRNKSFLSNLNEFFRRIVIKRMGHFITQIHGDYKLAQKWYKASGKHHECFMYTSNLYKEILSAPNNSERNTINILVGNSADPSNNHIDVFNKLFPFKEQNINIFVPLSYGNREYAKNVIATGKIMFGNKFNALTDFLNAEQYNLFLSNIDIAIFNHKRQQAMGNITTLLGMKVPVFLRKDTTSWEALSALGLTVYDIDTFSLLPLKKEDLVRNMSIIMRVFSMSKLKTQLEQLFRTGL